MMLLQIVILANLENTLLVVSYLFAVLYSAVSIQSINDEEPAERPCSGKL